MRKQVLSLIIGTVILLTFSRCTDDEITLDAVDIQAIAAGVAETNYTIAENDLAQTITVDFGAELPSSIKFDVAISGTAEYGVDYKTSLDEANGSYFLSVPAGSSSKSFTFTPIDDDFLDNEDLTAIFTVTTEDERIDLTSGTITVTIQNDDIYTEIELFLMNSVKTTMSHLDLGCGSQPAVEIDYDETGIPIKIYFWDLYYNVYYGSRTDGPPPVDPYLFLSFDVEYDEDSIWFALDEFNYGEPRLSQELPPEGLIVLVAEIENGKLVKVKNLPIGGGEKRQDGPPEPEIPEYNEHYFEYDTEGRVSYITFMSPGYQYGPPPYSEFYEFSYSGNDVDIFLDYEYDEGSGRTDGVDPGEPYWSLTMDGKNNPLADFAGLPYLMFDGYRTYFHAVLPSNLVSGYESNQGPIENNYSYNSMNYPTGSVTTKGYTDPARTDIGYTEWQLTFQYLDMDGGDDPDYNTYCLDR